MTTKRDERSDDGSARIWLAPVLAGLVLAYVLASGPAMLMHRRNPWDSERWAEPLDSVFRPLEWLSGVRYVGEPLKWYWARFGDRSSDKFESVADELI